MRAGSSDRGSWDHWIEYLFVLAVQRPHGSMVVAEVVSPIEAIGGSHLTWYVLRGLFQASVDAIRFIIAREETAGGFARREALDEEHPERPEPADASVRVGAGSTAGEPAPAARGPSQPGQAQAEQANSQRAERPSDDLASLAAAMRRERPSAGNQIKLLEYMEKRESASYEVIAHHVHGASIGEEAIRQNVRRVNNFLREKESRIWFKCGGSYVVKDKQPE
jgi:hypothetical protein